MQKEFNVELDQFGIKITKYNPTKSRPLTTSKGTVGIDKFCKIIIESISTRANGAKQFPNLVQASLDSNLMTSLIEEYAKEKEIYGDIKVEREVVLPDAYKDLVLNVDQSHEGREIKFFMTTPSEHRSEISGPVFIRASGMSEQEAFEQARKVTPEYMPRSPRGLSTKVTEGEEVINIFNSYIPPRWQGVEKKFPDRLPVLFEKLTRHVFPIAKEREYFYAWLYMSLFKRSPVYLVLCGAPGVGKNTLKNVCRALHGFTNTVDGKKSTFSGQFNAQFENSTLNWYDELHYTQEMENAMKEVQNDTISIERKGFDATRSTRVYASFVIANNKPRDNYIAFDARKFAPLVLNPKRLETTMSMEEIDLLTKKVKDWTHPEFDIEFLAHIVQWLKKHAKPEKFHNMEYRGPMFYKLAHTSMSRWQKRAAISILSADPQRASKLVFDEKKGLLWSTVEESVLKKQGDKAIQFPDYTTVKHFFDIFLDTEGDKPFTTEVVKGDIAGDFWVKATKKKVHILTEAEVLEEVGGEEHGGL